MINYIYLHHIHNPLTHLYINTHNIAMHYMHYNIEVDVSSA